MVFKHFQVQCVVRVLLLVATGLVFAVVLPRGQPATLGVCGFLVLWQTYGLIRYVQTTNRSLSSFLRTIRSGDFSQGAPLGPAGASFAELRNAFNEILDRLRGLNLAREENLRYLQAVVQHIGIGILAYRTDGGVELVNHAVKSLLDIPAVRTLEDLASVSPELERVLRALQPGQRDLVAVSVHGEPMHLSLHATELRQRRQTLTLVSVQNVGPELNEKEMDAWRDLIRILTHEIRNSLTPLASLAASVEHMLATEEGGVGKGELMDAEKAREALGIIQKRSRGLLKFVDTYRDLTHIPAPEIRRVPVADLFGRLEVLIQPRIEGRALRFRTRIEPESMILDVDPQLTEQVLLNLVLNAIEATEGRDPAEITVEARFNERSRPVIRVSDNGPGIVAGSLEKIFLPFYSTKKEGSGIGLSLSRQIMRMHRGDLTVESNPGHGATFTMRF